MRKILNYLAVGALAAGLIFGPMAATPAAANCNGGSNCGDYTRDLQRESGQERSDPVDAELGNFLFQLGVRAWQEQSARPRNGAAASSQFLLSDQERWLAIGRVPSLQEADKLGRAYGLKGGETRIFKEADGGFVVVVDRIAAQQAEDQIHRMRHAGAVPQGAFLTRGATFVEQIQSGASSR